MAERNEPSEPTGQPGSGDGPAERQSTQDGRQPAGPDETAPNSDPRGVEPGGEAGGRASATTDPGGHDQTRRQLLKAGVGLGAVGAVGYAYLRSQEDVVAATNGSTVDDVPGRSEFVFSWTGTELLTADGFEAAVDQELRGLAIDDASRTAELFDTITAGTAIDPRETGEVSAFGRLSSDVGTYAGFVFESETDPETVRTRLDEQGYLLDTFEHRDRTLWLIGNERLNWDLVLCHLDGNRYALGTRAELKDIIDLRAGESQRIGGRVIDGYDSAGAGLLSGGFVVPPEAFADLDLAIATELANSIEYGFAAIADGVLTVTFVAPDDTTAEDLDQTLNALGQLDQDDLAGQIGTSAVAEVVLALLDDLDTERSGSEVTATVTDGFRIPALVVRTVLERALLD